MRRSPKTPPSSSGKAVHIAGLAGLPEGTSSVHCDSGGDSGGGSDTDHEEKGRHRPPVIIGSIGPGGRTHCLTGRRWCNHAEVAVGRQSRSFRAPAGRAQGCPQAWPLTRWRRGSRLWPGRTCQPGQEPHCPRLCERGPWSCGGSWRTVDMSTGDPAPWN